MGLLMGRGQDAVVHSSTELPQKKPLFCYWMLWEMRSIPNLHLGRRKGFRLLALVGSTAGCRALVDDLCKMTPVSEIPNFPPLKLLPKQRIPMKGHVGRFERLQASRTIPGHHHPIELDLSALALSGLSLALALYVLRIQRDEEKVKRIEVAQNFPLWGWQPPPWSQSGEEGWCLRTPQGRLPHKQPIPRGFFQAVLYLPVQYQQTIPMAALTFHATKC